MDHFFSPDLHQSTAPFSHAVTCDGLVYTAGIIGQDPVTGAVVSEDAATQCSAMLDNLGTLLEGVGISWGNALRTTVYLTDYADFAAVNEVYGSRFPSPYPARTTLQVAALPLGAKVQIDAVFRAPDPTTPRMSASRRPGSV
ncbi:RidA family protein [Corynebacterium nuruki]|uniref:RidA family protein n=1 Tax=Corynebacterium nuruki TaxID=1032851 RepID=UPI0039BFE8C3